MKKIIIALIVLGILAFGVSLSSADQTRTINHRYKAIAAGTSSPNTVEGNYEMRSVTIYRITGVATSSNAVFGIYNVSAQGDMSVNDNLAIEGGEATSGDALPHMYFGKEGIRLAAGTVVRAIGCTIVLEYL
ncbi:hypothetical protein LCGC14_1044160 [marine sediment metagenome]|uniref:Uncharacterized protein n=1 Tax=marine sediment metagenome TaxID=412755 RepID=A0A0F9MQS6_9ZZZZ